MSRTPTFPPPQAPAALAARTLPAWLLLVLAVGCGQGTPYTIEVTPASMAAGASAAAEVRFVPGAGFKWNDEFPARLKVVDAGTAKVSRPAFAQADGDFKDRGGVGSLRIDVTAGTAGATALRTTADFSMCNPDECRIFRAIPIEIPVEVR